MSGRYAEAAKDCERRPLECIKARGHLRLLGRSQVRASLEHRRRFGQHRRGLRFWSGSQHWGQRCARQILRCGVRDRSSGVRLLRCFPLPLGKLQRLFPLVLLLHEEDATKRQEDNADYNVLNHKGRGRNG
jgi:hypothetical protein